MPGLVCNACKAEFPDDAAHKVHYRSDWHHYNLRRKVAGVPGVTQALFNLRLEALEAEKRKLEGESLLYKCSICDKEYRSNKAHAQHLRSKLHILKASARSDTSADEITITRPVPNRPVRVERSQKFSGKCSFEDSHLDGPVGRDFRGDTLQEEDINEEWEEWEEIEESEMSDGRHEMDGFGGNANVSALSDKDLDDWDASQCFICDLRPDGTVESCVEHMHKMHGFFIPDAEYLKDPRGMLSYLGLKVAKGFACLYCDEQGKHFQSLEAVRKHMISKSHCKLRFGDEGLEEELVGFYDFSSSYSMEEDSQVMLIDGTVPAPVSLSGRGSELIIRHESKGKQFAKVLGSREFARYYKQRPRPSDQRDSVLVNAVVARYRSMGLATRQPQDSVSSFKETKQLPQFRAEVMRTRLAMKNNVIRNLPRNVTY